MPPPSLVAIVVTHNRWAQLAVTLERLLESTTLDRVVVCDNASTDDTRDRLAEMTDPRLDVLRLDENRGGAGGFEAALRHGVAAYDADWYVLMDDDGRPIPGALSAFVDAPRDQAQAWAAAVTYPDGDMCDMNRPWTNPFKSVPAFLRGLTRGRDGFHLDEAAYNGTAQKDIDGGSFVGLFLSRDAIRAAGFPDGRLFLYGDDVLYTLALSRTGARIKFDPALRFEHDCKTVSKDDIVMRPLWKVYFFHRNQLLVYRDAAGAVMFWPVAALRIWQWRRRAAAYGADADAYRMLLRLAVRDGLARDLTRTRAEIEAMVVP